jgi:hypothetical protein
MVGLIAGAMGLNFDVNSIVESTFQSIIHFCQENTDEYLLRLDDTAATLATCWTTQRQVVIMNV